MKNEIYKTICDPTELLNGIKWFFGTQAQKKKNLPRI